MLDLKMGRVKADTQLSDMRLLDVDRAAFRQKSALSPVRTAASNTLLIRKTYKVNKFSSHFSADFFPLKLAFKTVPALSSSCFHIPPVLHTMGGQDITGC